MKELDCSPPGFISRLHFRLVGQAIKPVRSGILLVAGLALLAAGPLPAANLAPLGSAILGVNDAIDGDAGTPPANGGALANIQDENLNSRVDTWFGGDPQLFSYVGVVWAQTRYDHVQTLSLTLATFSDGGWFGVSGFSPEPGTALLSFDLVEPTIQVTTDGGPTGGGHR